MRIFNCRYADSSNAPPGHPSYVRKRLVTLLLRVLHLRNCRGAIMARDAATTLLLETTSTVRVSTVSISFFNPSCPLGVFIPTFISFDLYCTLYLNFMVFSL